VTSLLDQGFSSTTTAIWAVSPAASKLPRYVMMRKVVPLPKTQIIAATAFATAAVSGDMEKLLGAYRLYVGGVSVGIGPGRGEAKTAAYTGGGDKNHTGYDSIDIGASLKALSTLEGGSLALGLQCYHPTGDSNAMAMLEVHIEYSDGSKTVIGTDASWHAFDATDAFGPSGKEGRYNAPQENIVASLMPTGWTEHDYKEESKEWSPVDPRSFPVPPYAKSTLALNLTNGIVPAVWEEVSPGIHFADFGTDMMGGIRLEVVAKTGTKFQVTLSEELVSNRTKELLYPMRTGNTYRSLWTARGGAVSVFEHHEYMLFRYAEVRVWDGYNSSATCSEHPENEELTLHCPSGPGATPRIESVLFASYGTPTGGCKADAGNDFKASLCDAKSSRSVVEKACIGKASCTINVSNAVFGGDPCHGRSKRLAADVHCSHKSYKGEQGGNKNKRYAAPAMKLSAWQVAYPYYEGDSSFTSSNDMLNRVWGLCQNSLRVTSLDTATDSNTRERLPYEADNYITTLSRLSLQREFAWNRHSWRHNAYNPTWPTEWRQTLTLFGELDYDTTGSLGLLHEFGDSMEMQSQAPCVSKQTSLVDFNNCSHQIGGLGSGAETNLRDIIDWPVGSQDGYVLTDINTVISAYMVGNLRALAKLHAADGSPDKAKALVAQANYTEEAVNRLCVNSSTGLYTDGWNPTTREPVPHSAWHATVFPTGFGLLQRDRWQQALSFLREKRMAGSVYAAFWFLRALYNMDDDHGNSALEMLTQCDTNSWCHMLKVGATAVMEAWSRAEKANLSWSHPWASAPASAVVTGFFGITPISPGYKTYSLKPQPGNVTHASIKVPTLSGYIEVTLAQIPGKSISLVLRAPASTSATVCLPRLGSPSTSLLIDGKTAAGYVQRDYICVPGVGSSASGFRTISRASDY